MEIERLISAKGLIKSEWNEMSKKTSGEMTFKKLDMPSSWGTQFALVYQRVKKLTEDYVESKAGKNYGNQTLKVLSELIANVNSHFKAKPPRTISDAHAYALSRSYEGTFLACLDEDGNLVKTIILKKDEILSEIPDVKIVEEELSITMKARFITIEGLTEMRKGEELPFKRAIPKRVVKVTPFATPNQKIQTYG